MADAGSARDADASLELFLYKLGVDKALEHAIWQHPQHEQCQLVSIVHYSAEPKPRDVFFADVHQAVPVRRLYKRLEKQGMNEHQNCRTDSGAILEHLGPL